MKTRCFTPVICFLMALSQFCSPVRAQLKLPWEKDTVPSPLPAAPAPDPEPEPPPVQEEAAVAAPTAVEAVYRAWADRIFAHTGGSVRIGSPQMTAKKISVSVTLKGERMVMVFMEKSSDGQSARVLAGPKDSEGEFFGAEKRPAGWVLSSWPEGFRGDTGEPEPEMEPEANGAPVITWEDLSDRRLSRRDLQGLSREELRLLRNEIYARHGQIFKSEELRAHFSRQSWYRPRFKEVDDGKFAATVKHNLGVIMAAEKE